MDLSRQSDLIPETKLQSTNIAVVGNGAVGRNVSIQLAQIGAESLVLVDHDMIDDSNVSTQGFFNDDIGRSKVSAVYDHLKRINPAINVVEHCRRYRSALVRDCKVIFSCVDSIEVREAIARDNPDATILDSRVLGELIWIFTSQSRAEYMGSFFPESEAESGRCTAKMTAYSAYCAASLLIAQFARWLRGAPMDCRLMLDLSDSAFLLA